MSQWYERNKWTVPQKKLTMQCRTTQLCCLHDHTFLHGMLTHIIGRKCVTHEALNYKRWHHQYNRQTYNEMPPWPANRLSMLFIHSTSHWWHSIPPYMSPAHAELKLGLVVHTYISLKIVKRRFCTYCCPVLSQISQDAGMLQSICFNVTRGTVKKEKSKLDCLWNNHLLQRALVHIWRQLCKQPLREGCPVGKSWLFSLTHASQHFLLKS